MEQFIQVRHAQGIHNVEGEHNYQVYLSPTLFDAHLTPLGWAQVNSTTAVIVLVTFYISIHEINEYNLEYRFHSLLIFCFYWWMFCMF